MDEIPPLLAELLLAPGPSGFEDAVHAVVRREATGFGAEVTGDVPGSTSARVRGTGAGRTLALFAHADQVGMIVRGAVVSPLVGDRLLDIAEQERIGVALESGQGTASDADGIFTTGAGVSCAIVCVPLRYMHTAGEIVQLSDVDEASRLVEAYARSLRDDESFVR